MVIDHINVSLLGKDEIWMYLIGRGAFPLFCYALAVAMLRASPAENLRYALQKYALRLMAVGLLTEPVSRFTRDISELNVLFTLGFAAAFAALTRRLKDTHRHILLWVMAAGAALQPFCEFGLPGIALPAALIALLEGRKSYLPVTLALLYLMNVSGMPQSFAHDGKDFFTAGILAFSVITAAAAIGVSLFTLKMTAAQTQFPRFLPKYALHIFYPAHLALLWLLQTLFFTAK